MPKQNSALAGTTAGRSSDAPRPEFGENQVRDPGRVVDLLLP